MKAQLIFNLDDPQDVEEHNMAINASSMAVALAEIRQRMLRPSYKHGFNDEYLNEVNEKYPELFPKLIEIFNEICEEYGVMDWT
jgi:hypothetical protein